MLPALVGGLGMLFLPSLALAALAAALRVGSDTQPSWRSSTRISRKPPPL